MRRFFQVVAALCSFLAVWGMIFIANPYSTEEIAEMTTTAKSAQTATEVLNESGLTANRLESGNYQITMDANGLHMSRMIAPYELFISNSGEAVYVKLKTPYVVGMCGLTIMAFAGWCFNIDVKLPRKKKGDEKGP